MQVTVAIYLDATYKTQVESYLTKTLRCTTADLDQLRSYLKDTGWTEGTRSGEWCHEDDRILTISTDRCIEVGSGAELIELINSTWAELEDV